MLRLKLQYLGHLMWRVDSTEKALMMGKIEGRRRRGRQDEMFGWPHQLNGHEFEKTLRDSKGQGSLACWVHGVKNSWTWLSNWKTIPCMCAKSLQSCLTLCNPMDCRLSDFSVQRVLQAGVLEWVAIFFYRWSSQPWDQTRVSYVSCTGRQFFTTSATWEAPTQGTEKSERFETELECGTRLWTVMRIRLRISSSCFTSHGKAKGGFKMRNT